MSPISRIARLQDPKDPKEKEKGAKKAIPGVELVGWQFFSSGYPSVFLVHPSHSIIHLHKNMCNHVMDTCLGDLLHVLLQVRVHAKLCVQDTD